MRVTLFFMAAAVLVLLFFAALQNPRAQESFPALAALDLRLKSWLGLEARPPNGSADFRLAKPDSRIAEIPDALPETEDCGPPPVNPWVQKGTVSPVAAERYEMALRIWEYCKQQGRKGKDTLPTYSPSRESRLEHQLDDYPEKEGSNATGALPAR